MRCTGLQRPPEPPGPHPSTTGGGTLARSLLLLWLSGTTLRLTILALPPVLPRVAGQLGLQAADIGLLTGMPPLLFALAAVPGVALVTRLGPASALLVGLVLNALGAACRGLADGPLTLEAATALMCLGVAVMQPALPPLVRSWVPSRVGFATAVYTNGLLVGELAPVTWVPRPVLPIVGGDWRASLVVWAAPVLATALVMRVLGRRPVAASGPAPRWWPSWRDRRVWRCGTLLGCVNAVYFGLNGFMPGWLAARGWPALVQPALIALNLAQIPASLLLLVFAGRLVRSRLAYGITGLLLLAGVSGIVLMPGPAAIAWAALAGFAGATLLTLALTLPALLSEAADVPRLSGAMFTVSYGLAMAAAVLGGRLWAASGSPQLAFLPLVAAAMTATVCGAMLRPRELRMQPA